MGLENLKSVFSDIKKFKLSDVTKLNSNLDNAEDLTSTKTIFGNSPQKIGQDVNLLPPTPDKISLFPPEHSTELNFNPRVSLPKNFQSIIASDGQNAISFEKTNMVELETFSPSNLDSANTIPYIQNTVFSNNIDFTPDTSNDVINIPFNTNPMLKALDFTPLTADDEVSKFSILDFIPITMANNKNNLTPNTDNDVVSKFSVLDFIPVTMANNKNNLSDKNLDDINVVSPFQTDHFFNFGENFTKNLGNLSGIIPDTTPQIPTNISEVLTVDTSNSSLISDRISTDTRRIDSFLESQKGISFIDRQLAYGTYQKYHTLYDPASTLIMVGKPSEGSLDVFMPVSRNSGLVSVGDSIIQAFGGNPIDPSYSEYIDARSLNLVNNQTYAEYDRVNKPLAYGVSDIIGDLGDTIEKGIKTAVSNVVSGILGDSSKPKTENFEALHGDLTIPKEVAGINGDTKITSIDNINNDMSTTFKPLGNLGKGDLSTLQPIKEIIGTIENPNLIKHGLPLYFRDLRDNRVIFFRAYIDGITDTIGPSWSSENYVGRSEPVYTYTGAEREIGFNLKLFANTKDELNRIYEKINRLTSMCYPEYKKQETIKFENTDTEVVIGSVGGKERMKAPLTKLRLGDLFGNSNNEMVGFIKSLSYAIPEESVWEIEKGKQVPKYIEASIGFQVIHSTVPSLNFAKKQLNAQNTFYGITEKLMEEG